MRFSLLPVAALAVSLLATSAHAINGETWSVFGINGNDTGGIIPWSPQLRAFGYREAAQEHCKGFHKIARITSVKARYGDYVGFACEFPRNYDPVGHGDWWMKPMFGIF
ncbi:MAG TPA: hypothetical protein VL286_05530 [Rhizomicrobium sp.]|nr:hypothetical protein [Rhizomicrobium sp.]